MSENKGVIEAYPLCWPAGWKRTAPSGRKPGRFGRLEEHNSNSSSFSWKKLKDVTVADGVSRVMDELARFGHSRATVIISTNIPTRLDGTPRSDRRVPEDPGCAAYWGTGDGARCIACDRYTEVGDNLAAIAATLDAMRAIERHGGAEILNRVFTGFKQLTGQSSTLWREALGFSPEDLASLDLVTDRFRSLAKQHHPDVGGDRESWEVINQAINEARKELA